MGWYVSVLDYHAITSKQVYTKINTINTYELSMRSTDFDCIPKKSCFLFVLKSRSQYSLPSLSILQFCHQEVPFGNPLFMFCLYIYIRNQFHRKTLGPAAEKSVEWTRPEDGDDSGRWRPLAAATASRKVGNSRGALKPVYIGPKK
jgi:hypothetical protein